jgi:DNA-binding response OmpR family regulator
MMETASAFDPLAREAHSGASSSRAVDDDLEVEAADSDRGLVLVVDDEPSLVELVGEYLAIQGFAVVTANSGMEALARLDADRPDAVLLDMRMPGMDGFETLRRMVARNSSVRVLIVSGNDDVALMKEAIALGAFDYILKPIDFSYLSRALDQMIRPLPSVGAGGGGSTAAPPASESASPYDLALDVCRAMRAVSPGARQSVGVPIEHTALLLVREGLGGERRTILRLLGELRTLLRFAKDMGDITDDLHRQLESQMVRVRRGLGMS